MSLADGFWGFLACYVGFGFCVSVKREHKEEKSGGAEIDREIEKRVKGLLFLA